MVPHRILQIDFRMEISSDVRGQNLQVATVTVMHQLIMCEDAVDGCRVFLVQSGPALSWAELKLNQLLELERLKGFRSTL